MLLQLKPLFMGEKERLPVDAALDLSALEYQGERPFQSPVKVTGEVINAAEVVTVRMHCPFSCRSLTVKSRSAGSSRSRFGGGKINLRW